MALDKITTDGETNSAWRTAINGGLDLLNSDILQADTTIAVTQSGNQSTTQCVVSGHTSATFNASDYSNDAAQTIQAAIDSIPVNLSGYGLTILIGDETGQTIEISDQIRITAFSGDTIVIKSAKESDNSTNSYIKANKIQSEGATLDRLFNVYYNSCEVNIKGLQFIQDTSTVSLQFVLVVNHTFADISYCSFTGSGTTGNKYGVLSQRGANCYLRQSHFSNLRIALATSNSGWIASEANQHTGTQPYYGAYAGNGIILLNGYQIDASNADYFAGGGGLVTAKNGLILEETVLTDNKTVNFDNSMSIATMQGLINDQPKNLNGHDITFQFADGTYDFGTNQLQLKEFEGGTINVYGNTSNNDIENLDVIIQTEITGGNGAFLVEKCSRIGFKNIAFEQNGSNTDTNLLVIRYSSDAVVRGCSFNSLNGTTTNDGISVLQAVANIFSCKFKNLNINILAQEASRVFSSFTSDFSSGSPSNINLRAGSGAVITQTATQASGTNSKVANEGGVIFDKDGALV